MRRRFQQLDVFTDQTGFGNPLAVVVDADGLSDDVMARFARWTNLSETTFLLPPSVPGADYRVRIFTPAEELPFAGHPTLGTCRAWMNAGGEPRAGSVVQECGIGLVDLRITGQHIAFAAPPLRRSGAVEPQIANAVERALGDVEIVSMAWGDNGPGWIVVEIDSDDAVLSLTPTFEPGSDLKLGVFGPSRVDGVDYEVRAFFNTAQGHAEDPVTGSLNASVAVLLAERSADWTHYVARQGTAMGRNGRVSVERDGDTIWVGGSVTTSIDGTVDL